MNLTEYLEELTDSNWHTLRELIEAERGNIEPRRAAEALDALEVAIAYLEWIRHHDPDKVTLQEIIDRRLG